MFLMGYPLRVRPGALRPGAVRRSLGYAIGRHIGEDFGRGRGDPSVNHLVDGTGDMVFLQWS